MVLVPDLYIGNGSFSLLSLPALYLSLRALTIFDSSRMPVAEMAQPTNSKISSAIMSPVLTSLSEQSLLNPAGMVIPSSR